jgi:hypothetical protein
VLDEVALSNVVTDFAKRHVRALLASLALTAGFAWVLRAGALPLLPPEGTLDRLDAGLVASAGFCMLVSMLTRLARSQFLLAPIASISMRKLMTTLCVALGLITFLPFRLGEVARPALLRERGKLSGWAVTATVGAERIIDGVVFSVMLLTGLAFAVPHEPLPDRIGDLPIAAALVPRAAKLAAIGFGGLFVLMAVFFYRRQQARRVTEAVLGLISKKFATRLADAVEKMSDGLRFLPSYRHTGAFLVATAFSLGCHVVGMQLLGRAVGLPELTFAQMTVVFGVLALGFAVPNAPGFFGAIQLALYAGIALYVEPAAVVREGAAFVFVFYVLYLALVILIAVSGLIGEYVMPASGSSARATPSG